MGSGDCAIGASAQRGPRTRANSAAKLAWSRSDALIGGLRSSRGKASGEGRVNSGRMIQILWSARSAANATSAMRNWFCLRLAVELFKEKLYRMRAGQIQHFASLSPAIPGATRLQSGN